MKRLKTWHLFALVIVLFTASFYYINIKYDRFYRVKGINNENRQLIEKYLTSSEQDYLVENQIPIAKFIKYIKYKDFKLKNYQYYNLLQDTDRYSSKKTVIQTGNAIVDALSSRYDSNFYKLAQTIIENDLEYGLIHSKDFKDENIIYYGLMRPLYSAKDISYITDTATYLDDLALRNVYDDDALSFFTAVCAEYKKNSLKTLMQESNDTNVELITRPAGTDLYLNSNKYIGSYVPESLVLLQDVSRLKYGMYLRYDAYHALLKLNAAIKKQSSCLVVYQAYTSYKQLAEGARGHDEFQLGLSVKFTVNNEDYKYFDKTPESQWLVKNAYKYGFVLRYPKDKVKVTKHAYDAHIYRYVGTRLAEKMHEDNLALEEIHKQMDEVNKS